MPAKKITQLTPATNVRRADLLEAVNDPDTEAAASVRAPFSMLPFLQQIFFQTAFAGSVIPVGNTSTFIQAGKGSLVVPASYLRVGSVLRVRFGVNVSGSGSGTAIVRMLVNGNIRWSTLAVNPNPGLNVFAMFEGMMISATSMRAAFFNLTTADVFNGVGDGTVNLSVENTFDLRMSNVTDDEITVSPHFVHAEVLNPDE